MSRPFLALERFIERIFERPVNRLFRTRLQPVQLQRRLERAMETERRVGADRTYAPIHFRVQLHPDDLADFADYQVTLEDELVRSRSLRTGSVTISTGQPSISCRRCVRASSRPK